MRALPVVALLALTGLAACGGAEVHDSAAAPPPPARTAVALDTLLPAVVTGHGTADPIQQATLSTRLMGTVTAVEVREGQEVAAGQVLVRLDMRDLDARRGQVAATRSAAEAALVEAERNVERMRALYADSAAARVQLDAAESGYAQARAGVEGARAAAAEVAAAASYGRVVAPFAARVVRRHVDPGAFAAPGAPLVTIEDARRLRVRATLPPEAARGLEPGDSVDVLVEDLAARGRVEGVVPVAGRGLYEVNVVVANGDGRLASGGAARVEVVTGRRPGVLVPASAIRREGDLTGLDVVTASGTTLRWVRVGRVRDGFAEVLSGLRPGEVVGLPPAAGGED